MVTETAHRARLAPHAIEAGSVEAFRSHERDRDRAIEASVVGTVDALARPFTDEVVDLVPAAAERCRSARIHARPGAGRPW